MFGATLGISCAPTTCGTLQPVQSEGLTVSLSSYLGVNMVADASVHFLSYSVSNDVMRGMATMYGGEVVDLP